MPASLAFVQTFRGNSSASDFAEARALTDTLSTQEVDESLPGFNIDRFGKLIVNT